MKPRTQRPHDADRRPRHAAVALGLFALVASSADAAAGDLAHGWSTATAGMLVELPDTEPWRCDEQGSCTICRNLSAHSSAIVVRHRDGRREHVVVAPAGGLRICEPRTA